MPCAWYARNGRLKSMCRAAALTDKGYECVLTERNQNSMNNVANLNLLILSCGTRNLLVRYFKDRANGFARVVGTD